MDLKWCILLDNQSTVDLFCNPDFVEDTRRHPTGTRVKSNGGLLTVWYTARVPGYHRRVWFSTDAIATSWL